MFLSGYASMSLQYGAASPRDMDGQCVVMKSDLGLIAGSFDKYFGRFANRCAPAERSALRVPVRHLGGFDFSIASPAGGPVPRVRLASRALLPTDPGRGRADSGRAGAAVPHGGAGSPGTRGGRPPLATAPPPPPPVAHRPAAGGPPSRPRPRAPTRTRARGCPAG